MMEGDGKLINITVASLLAFITSLVGVKRQLLELKKELKCWETMFERKHGRKPNRVSDICIH